MKKFIILLIAATTLTIVSCKKLEDYNIDVKNAPAVPGSTLFANALRNLVDQETTTSVNENVFRAFAQYWAETTYPDETNYDLTTRLIPDYEFRTVYRDILANLKEAKRVIPMEPGETSSSPDKSSAAEKKNKIAVTEILTVYSYQREVDIFGNVPYSQALDISVLNPVYDDAKTIYASLFARLDLAIADIDVTAQGFKDGDLVYYGDMVKWKMFANGLKIKLAIGVADIASLDPGTKINEALASGIFTSSADNATFTYLNASPNTNPIWTNLVNSGRNDWVAANTIVDWMDSLSDPRMPLYFEQNLGAGVYDGGVYGTNNDYSGYTHITNTIQKPDWRGLLMSYSELQFYLAEAAAKGLIAGTPDTYYNAGITASIVDDWGGTAANATAYLADPLIAYATAPGTYKEKIGLQSWIAAYDRGMIGWTTWRRLDAPTLNIAFDSESPIPNRFTYPTTEQTLNGANYNAASAAMGGDEQSSKIFWDVY